eukprot:2107910-Pyramimonas_sp.AAC.1
MYAAADKTQDRTPGFVADHDAAEAVVALGSPGGARGRAARHHTDGEKLRSTRLTEGVRSCLLYTSDAADDTPC